MSDIILVQILADMKVQTVRERFHIPNILIQIAREDDLLPWVLLMQEGSDVQELCGKFSELIGCTVVANDSHRQVHVLHSHFYQHRVGCPV